MDKSEHWQQIYAEKSSSDVSWYQAEPHISLSLISQLNLTASSPIIDIGGGASVLVDRLLEQGYSNLAVLDIAANALTKAKERLGELAAKVEWYNNDVTEFQPKHRFKLWHDRAVFHFLTDKSDRRRYVDTIKRTVDTEAHLIFATFALGGPNKCSGLDIVQYDADKLLAEMGSHFELRYETTETHITPANIQQKFAYFLLDFT